MATLHSFLQTLFQFVKVLVGNVSKKMHRSAAVLTVGCTVISVVAFNSTSFGGGGKNALTAYAQIHPGDTDEEEEPEEDPDIQVLGSAFSEDLYSPGPDAEAYEDAVLTSDAVSAYPKTEFEESGLLAEAEVRNMTSGSDMGQALIGDVLEQDTMENVKSGDALRERVVLLQKEDRVRQVGDAAKRAVEEVRKKEEEAKRAALRIPYSDEDYQVMLKIVQAEAGGCDSTGKILVANVIMNRVRSGKFPDTITEVVYQKSQFSPVIDGSINRVKVTQDTIDCVNRALDGEDYSQGALYFMNRKASQAGNVSWFDGTLTYLFQHGSHEFFK